MLRSPIGPLKGIRPSSRRGKATLAYLATYALDLTLDNMMQDDVIDYVID